MAKQAPRAGLQRAFDRNQLVLFYQPIHELESRRIVAAEALLRARRESGEIRNAAPLTAAAEHGPDLYRLNSWTVKRAYADAASWQHDGGEKVRLNVNLSPREFDDGKVSHRLRKLVKGCGADAHKVNLEITETSFIENPKRASRALDELKELGVELWLDDFGTIHSSITHLLQFPIDGIKLPAEFVKGIAGDGRSRAVVTHLVALAHDLDLRVIAEGVEHEDQLAVLREIDCDYIQGFLFSRPMPVEKFEKTLLTPPSRRRRSSPRSGSRGRGAARGRASRSS